jgi:hypothetical protein
MLVAASSPDHSWVALCQARRDTDGDGVVQTTLGAQGELLGDRLEGFLVTEPGPGAPIESFAGSDPSGRFIAVVRSGHLVLRDNGRRSELDLSASGADVRDDRSSFANHRAVSFDPMGRRMLYLRTTDAGSRVVVRTLDSGSETIVDPGDGELWRAEFDGTGEHVLLSVVTSDSNRNGKLDWSVWPAKEQHMRCPPPIAVFSVWEYPGDRAILRIAPVTGGDAEEAPELVTTLGDARVERHADGTLLLRRTDGKRVVLLPPKCESRLLHTDSKRQLVLATCRQKNSRHQVWILGDGFKKALDLEMATTGGDRLSASSPRLVALHAGQDGVLVDMDRRVALRLTAGTRVLATSDDRALVLAGDDLSFESFDSKMKVPVGQVLPFATLMQRGSIVGLAPWAVDVEQGATVGRISEAAMALAVDGFTFVPTGGAADASHLAAGPGRWIAPTR